MNWIGFSIALGVTGVYSVAIYSIGHAVGYRKGEHEVLHRVRTRKLHDSATPPGKGGY
jgi:hypothetical protein